MTGTGQLTYDHGYYRAQSDSTGVLRAVTKLNHGTPGTTTTGTIGWAFNFDASFVVPTGAYTVPRAIGVLACVYLGS